MRETRLIIVTGMSGSGKSTTSRRLAEQIRAGGARCKWLHEEMRRHPIRDGEFAAAPLDTPEGMEINIADMYRRWDRLVARILRSKSIYVMEGVLFDNILRYFYRGHASDQRIQGYFTGLLAHLSPANPVVVFLHRPDVRANLERLYPARGQWWKELILDPTGMGYAADHGLVGEEGAYQMWEAYEALSGRVFDCLPGPKIRIDTSGMEYERCLEQLTGFLGLGYTPTPILPVPGPAQYLGRYAVTVGDRREEIEIGYDGTYLFCRAWWPYMRLIHLGRGRFQFDSFPIRLTFRRDAAGRVTAARATGNYDWEIVGQTLAREA